MELVEGEDLARRLERGAIPVEEAIAIARQIAEALEAAHEKGIVHRDLKPANVKVRPDGTVKVLDFGLAKALDPTTPGAAADLAHSPTITHAATQAGLILGTAAYMAPEQAAGAAVDTRADIWAFGVVLYEMLTGTRLFAGESVSHVLAGVLKDAPDLAALPAATPLRIVDLVRRCLRKKPRERLQAIGDARVVIDDVLADPHAEDRATVREVPAALAAPRRRSRLAWLVAMAGLATATLFATLWFRSGGSVSGGRVFHAALLAPVGTGFGDTFALSPDGRRIVFEALDRKTGGRTLWLRELDHGEATRLAPTEGGEMPFWSPDGAQLGFFAEGKLQRLDLRSGSAQTICDAPTPRGGAWGPDGRIVFSASFRAGLSAVAAGGGAPRPLTELDAARHEKSHRFPVFLPGGKTILFLAQTAEGGTRNDESTIEALELASGKRTRLIAANSSPFFSPPGQILFWHDGTLLAQRFDATRLKLSGEPAAVAAPVALTQNEQVLAAVSQEGTLVYLEGSRGTYSSLVWLDRQGLGIELIRGRELFARLALSNLALSHDGTRLIYSAISSGQGAADLWSLDLVRRSVSRLTFEEGAEVDAVWSRDDRAVYYRSDLRNDGTIFRRAADGSGAAEEIGTTPSGIWPLAASGDGRWLVIGTVGATTGRDLLRFDLATRELTPLVETSSFDEYPALSPDDRLLAYASEQSGRWEVYAKALGGGQGTWQISTEGGLRPRWRADGRELYFLARPDRVMAVDVEPGAVPRFSAPRELFRQPIEDFDVAPDGQRFVALRTADADLNRPLTLITSWTHLVPQR
jgi:serine/threonine-protein kinase